MRMAWQWLMIGPCAHGATQWKALLPWSCPVATRTNADARQSGPKHTIIMSCYSVAAAGLRTGCTPAELEQL